MTDQLCGYPGDRDEALVAFLYDDINAIDRATFQAHLATCELCREELEALRGVRTQLGRWAPPPLRAVEGQESTIESRPWWREMPAWAQVAAAMLFVGVSAGIANLDIRYDRDGLNIRTGWSRTTAPNGSSAQAVGTATGSDAVRGVMPRVNIVQPESAPWRAELIAFERQLRSEMKPAEPARTRAASGDDEILRRVRALIAESERKQQNDVALRVAEVMRDVKTQRSFDLARISSALGAVQTSQRSTANELLKNRTDINYLVLASQRP